MRKKRLAAAIVVPLTFLGSTALISLGAGTAHADDVVRVCKRMVLETDGWVCVESTQCWYNDSGDWWCDDGSYGGPSRPSREPLRD